MYKHKKKAPLGDFFLGDQKGTKEKHTVLFFSSELTKPVSNKCLGPESNQEPCVQETRVVPLGYPGDASYVIFVPYGAIRADVGRCGELNLSSAHESGHE